MSRVWKGPELGEPCVEGNLVSFIFKDAHRWKNLPALECGDTGRTLTYAELQLALGRWGAWLARCRGHDQQLPMVAKFGPPSLDVAVVHLGTMAVGAVYTVLVNTAGPRELADQMKCSGTTLVVAAVEFLPRLKAALEKLGRPMSVVVIGDIELCDTRDLDVVTTYEAIMKDESLTPMTPVELPGEETAHLLYTSGSTGLPKAVEHRHNSLITNIRVVTHPTFNTYQPPTCAEDQTRYFLCRDFGLAFPAMYAFLPGLTMGACLIIKPFDESTIANDFERLKFSSTILVPPNLPPILHMARERPGLLKRLKNICVSGGPIPVTVLKTLSELAPHVFVQKCYGASEAGIITLDPITGGKLGFMGQICANVTAKVLSLDGKGQLLPANERGILFVKSDTRMKGYLNNPTATREVMDEQGWYNTGDVGLVDEEGFIQVLDRLKELIKTENVLSVSPTELENTISELEGVHEACVVGVPRADTGMDNIYAFVTKKADCTSDVTEDCIKNYVTAQLSRLKCPKKVAFVEKLPQNQSGKFDRVLLKQRASEMESSK